jgi:hypothetical protein
MLQPMLEQHLLHSVYIPEWNVPFDLIGEAEQFLD